MCIWFILVYESTKSSMLEWSQTNIQKNKAPESSWNKHNFCHLVSFLQPLPLLSEKLENTEDQHI